MAGTERPNAEDVRKVIEDRLAALDDSSGYVETTNIEWRGQPRAIPVISMPVNLLVYNPDTHRVRAQRTLDPDRDAELTRDPYGVAAQAYLHDLLMADPSDPAKTDPEFAALKDDLQDHSQREPGIITRAGVLINGNTRRAALVELGTRDIRVGVLPSDAALSDSHAIELSLQLRRDHKRDYSFVNRLLAIEEQVTEGVAPTDIQKSFRIRAATYDRDRWILAFIREAIERSSTYDGDNNIVAALRLVDFETDKGKLEELQRTYASTKAKVPEDAEALREQRLLALALGKSKTDLRLIGVDFYEKYLSSQLPAEGIRAVGAQNETPLSVIPGTDISVPPPSQRVVQLRAFTDQVLKARAVAQAAPNLPPEASTSASKAIGEMDVAVDEALEAAGKNARIVKRRYAASERISDANDDLRLAADAIADARAKATFQADDLDTELVELRANLLRIAQQIERGSHSTGDGIAWLLNVVSQQ